MELTIKIDVSERVYKVINKIFLPGPGTQKENAFPKYAPPRMDLKKAPPAFKKAFAEKIAEGKGDAARGIISGYVAGDGMIPKEKYAEIYKKILEI